MSKQIDLKAILMFASVAALAFVLFSSYNEKPNKLGTPEKPNWGPMAGSGPGISPQIIEAECPRHKQRPTNINEVDAYNPAAAQFASV